MQSAKFQQLWSEAVTHLQAGRLDAAARSGARLRATAPRDFSVLHLCGLVALQQGRAADAAEALAIARRLNPRAASTVMCLGLAWSALGRHDEAEAALRDALTLAPDSAETWVNLGAVLIALNRGDEAIDCYRRATGLKPGSAAGWTGLGSALLLVGRGGEALAHHDRALALEPKHPRAQFSRAQALLSSHQPEAALADFDAHIARMPAHLEARSFRLFALNYLDALSREQLFAEHCSYGRAAEAAVSRRRTAFLNSAEPARLLRIGFLSPDLRQHSVAYFIEPILRHLDRAQFAIHLYHDHPSVDGVSQRLRGLAASWRNFAGQSADTVEAAIRADAPDLLVDLAGHTGHNRLALLARRLAPVQVNYLGYPNTTGLGAMDFRFTDAVADPVGDADRLHTERLVRFAPTAWTYEPPAVAPEPAASGRTGAAVTFGSFNALSKLSGSTLRLWAEVLRATPGSQLALKSGGLEPAAWQARLAAHGIAPGQVRFLPHQPTVAGHLACYAELDVALDPFPYQGTTTTCEALWMGVPVVTLAGDRHAARVGASLLTAIGHPEWIASTPADYVRIATDLAADGARRADLRREMRNQMRGSALLDHAGQAARFGAALRGCWAEWCDRAKAAA